MREMKDSGIEWIGEIPKEWKTQKAKWIFKERNEKGNSIILQLLSPSQKYGVIPQSELDSVVKVKEDTDLSTFKTIHAGDYCISLRSFQGGFEYSKYEGVVSPAYHVFYANGKICDLYYKFLFKCVGFIEKIASLPLTLRDGKNISFDMFGDMLIPMPPLCNQENISAYLDNKCTKIDSIIEKQEKVIEKLKEYKLSVITEAVTKGLNPDMKMKDSGIEWIGEIPEHWEITSVARVAIVVRGASPRPAGDPLYFNGSDVPWITVAEVTKDEGKYIYETETFLTYAGAEKSRVVEKGTLLLSNSGATLGVPKITCITGCINDGSLAFYDLKMNQTYLLYIFKGRTFELRKQMQGYGQPNLNTSIVKAIQIPLPTEKEQVEICNYLDKKCSAIDMAIEKKQAIIEKLKEYKKSLIYEVVTGKREV